MDGKYEKKSLRLDSCMSGLISVLNEHSIETLACCCGHEKYHKTIVYKTHEGKIIELISSTEIPRKSRFYVKDKNGFYFIPEVEKTF